MTIQDSKILRKNPSVFTYNKESRETTPERVSKWAMQRERERVTKPGLAGNANQST